MQIDWMNIEELAEAIPPAYTRFLGEQLMQAVLYNREQEIA
jgi:DNA (cytosine-5)-methyltransferase 1